MIKWTLEACKAEAAKYTTRKKWVVGHRTSYNIAQRKGWLDECCLHMPVFAPRKDGWTLERCMEEAKKFETRSAWKDGHKCSYRAASYHGWLKECTVHMGKKRSKKHFPHLYEKREENVNNDAETNTPQKRVSWE
jgi:hypothetical protein